MKAISIFIFGWLIVFACSAPTDHREHDHVVTTKERKPHGLMLSDRQMKLANISTARVVKKLISQEIVISARLVADENKSTVLSSRVGGRIEKLYVKETGENIKSGQPLYVLYSEELLTLQQEYLLAKDQYELSGNPETHKPFLERAEKKLLLYGLTRTQISKLRRDDLRSGVTFLAPSSGIATAIEVPEGAYIREGTVLYRLEEVSSLWVEAEVYPEETLLVETGDKIGVMVESSVNGWTDAVITFTSPMFRNGSQVAIIRASLDNPGGRFKPGQQAHVLLRPAREEAVTVPIDAVIRDQTGSHVYVQSGDNTFREQAVTTGVGNAFEVEILEGLAEGDTIAVTGAYLLYSESQLGGGR